jgi:hypothetical protein
MNFMDLIKKSFSDSWTGGASIDPSTGLQGEPNRFHGPGAFDNFKMADLFDNDRWVRENRADTLGNPQFDRGGEKVYTSYYIPKTERREEDITDTTKIVDGVETRTFTRKYKTGGRSGEGSQPVDSRLGQLSVKPTKPFPLPHERTWDMGNTGYTPPWAKGVFDEEGPGQGSFAPWSDRAGQRQPMQHSPFRAQSRGVYHDEMPGSTRQQMAMPPYRYPLPNTPPPGWTPPIGTPMLPRGSWDRRARAQEQAIASGQRPYSYNMPQAEPYRSTPTRSGWNPGNLFDQARGDASIEGKLMARMLDPTYGDTIPVDVKRKMIELLLRRSD